MEKYYSRRKYIRIISFLSFLSILLCVWGTVNTVRAQRWQRQNQIASERAISELCENLDNITVMLQKGIYCNSEASLSDVSKKLTKSASCAKVSLSGITGEEIITDEIYKFLSQVGDFTDSLVRKAESGEELTSEERTAVEKLYNYSVSLSDGLGKLRSGYFDNTVVFEKSVSNLSLSEQETALFSQEMNDTEQSLTDYPTLIYDGPFSDSVLNRDAVFLKGKNEITASEAKKIAAKYLNTDITAIRQESDEKSKILLYCFSAGEKSIGITKKGGYLCYMTNPDYSGEAAIGEKEAVRRAKKYLEQIGYKSMKESYYADYDGVCTINFAYEYGGIVYYPDLIKVSVALDTGKIVAVDARSFITNHCERKPTEIKVSLEEAEKGIAKNLTLLGSQTALIPTEYGTEKLCHELHCVDSQKREVLIYVDVQTGQEDNILLLVYADGGTLTR